MAGPAHSWYVASINLINADFLTDNSGQAWVLPFELDRTEFPEDGSLQWWLDAVIQQIEREPEAK